MKEIWKPVPGYEEYYEVSNYGLIRSYHKKGKGHLRSSPQLLTPTKTNKGHYTICLSKNGRYKRRTIHRLVAMTFIGEIPKDKIVCHKDDDKENNCVSNLYIGTYSSNMIDALHNSKRDTVFTVEDVIDIRTNKSNKTISELADEYDADYGTMYNVVNNHSWDHVETSE